MKWYLFSATTKLSKKDHVGLARSLSGEELIIYDVSLNALFVNLHELVNMD